MYKFQFITTFVLLVLIAVFVGYLSLIGVRNSILPVGNILGEDTLTSEEDKIRTSNEPVYFSNNSNIRSTLDLNQISPNYHTTEESAYIDVWTTGGHYISKITGNHISIEYVLKGAISNIQILQDGTVFYLRRDSDLNSVVLEGRQDDAVSTIYEFADEQINDYIFSREKGGFYITTYSSNGVQSILFVDMFGNDQVIYQFYNDLLLNSIVDFFDGDLLLIKFGDECQSFSLTKKIFTNIDCIPQSESSYAVLDQNTLSIVDEEIFTDVVISSDEQVLWFNSENYYLINKSEKELTLFELSTENDTIAINLGDVDTNQIEEWFCSESYCYYIVDNRIYGVELGIPDELALKDPEEGEELVFSPVSNITLLEIEDPILEITSLSKNLLFEY
jgi:hypothetical protein